MVCVVIVCVCLSFSHLFLYPLSPLHQQAHGHSAGSSCRCLLFTSLSVRQLVNVIAGIASSHGMSYCPRPPHHGRPSCDVESVVVT